MTDNEKKADPGSEFDAYKALKHKRKAVRYIRDDIEVSIRPDSFLSRLAFGQKALLVQLIDISSKGLLIGGAKKFRVNQEIIVTLVFKDAKTFVLPARIVRVVLAADRHYGVKFSGFNHELGDYLLHSQEGKVKVKEIQRQPPL